jgi:glycosyltransferase involved in cell wall biosynthesis
MPYAQTLGRIAVADAVVQTSIGFETQGMTIFEAASLGTPSVVSDPDLAAELGRGFWAVGDGVTPDPSVAALAAALREAASDISAGTARVPDPAIRERFRQSSRTAAMAEVYARVTS